jgi:hypothetical protein
MKRRVAPVDELPPRLRVFTHSEWLKPDEDPTEPIYPIRCHATAPIRYTAALCEFLGVFPSDPTIAPYRKAAWSMASPDCPCGRCAPKSPKITRVPPLGSTHVPAGAGPGIGRFGGDDADRSK